MLNAVIGVYSKICLEKPEGGVCLAYFERYFYNATSELCEIFIYGGCGGNQNNFETLRECYDNCEGNSFQEFFDFQEMNEWIINATNNEKVTRSRQPHILINFFN